jgi:hypothetical protein
MLIARWMNQYRFEEAEAVACFILLLSIGTMLSFIELGNRWIK